MNYNKYNETTRETAVYPREVNNFGLAYCWFGLLGELSELRNVPEDVDPEGIEGYKKNIIKESGDVFWYVSEICNNVSDLNFERVIVSALEISKFEFPGFEDNYYHRIVEFSENIKKYYRDNKTLDINLMEKILSDMLASIISLFDAEANVSLEEVLQINYEKLHNRRKTGTLHGDGDHREEA